MMTLSVALILLNHSEMKQGLLIDAFRVSDSTRDGQVATEVVLKNQSKFAIRIWDPQNVEGQNCLAFLVRRGSAPEIHFKPLFPPRAAGVATCMTLAPGKSVALSNCDLSQLRNQAGVTPGIYQVTAVYSNDLRERPPVKDVWIGTIRSKPVKFKL